MEQPTFFFVYYHVFVLMTCLTRHSVFGSEELKKGQWTCSYYPTTVTSSSTGPISARQTPPSPADGAGTNATTSPSPSTARRSPSSTTSPATRSGRSLSSPSWCSSGGLAAYGRLIQTGGFNDSERSALSFVPCPYCDCRKPRPPSRSRGGTPPTKRCLTAGRS